MNRTRIIGLLAGMLGALALLIVWVLAYEAVCGIRWTPAEGSTKWALIQRQFSFTTWSSVTPEFFWLGPGHFYQRLLYLPMRMETLLRAGIALGLIVAGGGGLLLFHFATRRGSMHGDARFGSMGEAEQAGLASSRGLMMGSLNGRILRSDDTAHVIVVGPTRSGKGVSFVIPNGLAWPGSMVVLDIKFENFDAFGKARYRQGNKVFVFAPGSLRSHRYNPLDFVRSGPEMATDCANIAGFLVATSHETEWSMAARKLVGALLGYVLTSQLYRGQRYIRSAVRLISTGDDIAKHLKTIVEWERGGPVPNWVFDEFNQIIAIPERTRGSVMFNVSNAFAPWSSELICSVTETSDFDIRRLRSEQMSIFIGTPLADLESYRPLVRVLFQQIHDVLMRQLPGATEPHGVLLLLDEFFALGKMTSLASKIAVSAGYGFRMAIILQNISQLDEIYGQSTRETMVSGAALKLFVAINDNVTAKYVSDALGNYTAKSTTKVAGAGFQSARVSIGDMAVPLRRPQELTRMPKDRSIVFAANSRPFEVSKVYFYKNAMFRHLMASAELSVVVPVLAEWHDRPQGGPPTPVIAIPAVPAPSVANALDGAAESIETPKPDIAAPSPAAERAATKSPSAQTARSDAAAPSAGRTGVPKRQRKALTVVAPNAAAIAAAGIKDISAEIVEVEAASTGAFAEMMATIEKAVAELPPDLGKDLQKRTAMLMVAHRAAQRRRA